MKNYTELIYNAITGLWEPVEKKHTDIKHQSSNKLENKKRK